MSKISKFCVEKGYLVYIRVHQQKSFSILNRFCQLISKTLPPTQFLKDIIMLDGISSKNKWKHTFSLHCISSFEDTAHISFYNTVPRSFSSYCFTSVFRSADVIFHNFLELHSIPSETRFFMNVPFINRFTQSPPTLISLMAKSTKHNINFLFVLL